MYGFRIHAFLNTEESRGKKIKTPVPYLLDRQRVRRGLSYLPYKLLFVMLNESIHSRV